MNIKTRPSTAEDHNFILSTWLKSYQAHGNEFYKPSGKVYFKEHQELIKKKLDSCKVDIVTTDEDESQIIGYMVHDADCIHYVYIKNLFRNFKIAKKLVSESTATYYSQHTSYSKRISGSLIYNPYRFFNE